MNKFGQHPGEPASSEPPFVVSGWRGNRHFQTIWPNRIKRSPAGPTLARDAVSEHITSEDGDLLRVRWSHHARRGPSAGDTPVLIILHGLTGCADADNVMALAAKGYDLGFDVVRVDLRNTQADDAPSLGVGHAGRSEDLRATLRHIADVRPESPTTVIGFSLGGNIALKAAGEYGSGAPETLRAIAAISVPVDLDHACRAIDQRRENWIYRTYFLRRLARRYLDARKKRPDLFHPIDLDTIRGIRDWDNAVVAPLGGFADAEDYYARNSSLNVIDKIRVPTLIVHARDDPFIPFAPFETAAIRDNEYVRVLSPKQGGHVGFFSLRDFSGDPDRYWAENRALAACTRAAGLSWRNGSSATPTATVGS